MYIIDKNGNCHAHLLGNPLQFKTASFQLVMNAGDYFAAHVQDENAYSLVGCAVAPGFEERDFELADKTVLLEKYPQHRSVIEKLSR